MEDLKIKNSDIIKQIGIDKSTLSSLFTKETPLTKFQKAAFYYYFLLFEVNNEIRN
jgi:hypothetical protein